jgi:BASS family bile acid:Na+ symporter
MNVVMPLVALWISAAFGLYPAVKLALITLAISPVPPFLPPKMMKAGGGADYTMGLLTASALLSIVTVPLSVWVLGRWYHLPAHVDPGVVAAIVGKTILVPLALGIVAHQIAPNAARRAAKPISIVAVVVLVGAMIPLLIRTWPGVKTLLGNGTVLAIMAITVVGLIVGHFLGGPDRDDRTVLALATAARHPAVALAVAAATFPNEKLIVAAVVLSLIVTAAISAPYVNRSSKVHAGAHAAFDDEHDAEGLDISHAGRGNGRRG